MASLYVLPSVDPKAYDTIQANGIASPGVARITTPIAREYQWDRQFAMGGAGEFIRFKGIKVVEFTIEIQLIGDEALTAWESWVAQWDWDPVKRRATPVAVLHPLLSERGITKATAKKIHAPKQSRPGDNLWIGTIECYEWRPPPKRNVAKPAKTGNEARLEELRKQVNDEQKKLGL